MSEKQNALAAIGYIPLFFWLPLFLSGNDEFAKHHGKQAMVILVAWVLTILGIGLFLHWLTKFITPVQVVVDFVTGALYIFYVVFSILGAVKAAQGKLWRIPVVGAFAERINI
ncbi:DUF4870 domain-containing protein [candidate division WOR-3 bacterium]|nr:DUF4870 domain-containing protein [candidate division WOR-3 bacterium]